MHPHLVKHLVDTSFDLRFCEVFGQAHPGSIVESLLDGQILVDDVILWDIADLGAVSITIIVIILAVVEYYDSLCGLNTTQNIQQASFPDPRTPYHGHKVTP